MSHRTKFLTLLMLLFAFNCDKLPFGKQEVQTIYVGEPETILAEGPEDAFDVSYRWDLVDYPDESTIELDFSPFVNSWTFTADVVGDYAFAVTVISDGEELSYQEFRYIALEDTTAFMRAQPMADAPPDTQPEDTAVGTAPESVTLAAPTPAKSPPAPSISRAKVPRKKYRGNIVAGHFTIQVSSWKTPQQAQKVMQQVAQETGYDAYIQRVRLDSRNEVWWRVRVGDFTSLEDAKMLQEEIIATYPGTWVDNLRKEDIDPTL